MKDKKFIIKYRWHIVAVTLLLVGASIFPLLNIRVNPDLESYLHEDMPSRLNNLKINDVFGNEELLILVFQAPDVLQESTLTRIQNISEAFSESPDFKRVFSLFQVKDIRSEEGSMVVNPVVEFIPQTAEERDALRESIRTNDLAYKIVVSEDFQSAVIILTSEKTVQDEQLLLLVHQILDEYPGEEKVCITGNAYLRVETSEKIGQEIGRAHV